MFNYWGNSKLKLTEIIQVYEKIRALSREKIALSNYESALQIIETAAKIAYHFNWIYTDKELERQLKIISEQLIQPDLQVPIKGRIVFYDSWGWDNRGLTQQYIRALKSLDMEFMFIFENMSVSQSDEIRVELESYEKCEIFAIDLSVPFTDRLSLLHKKILNYNPEKLLMHITPWAVEALVVFHALTSVTKYQINLTDHTFWLGVSCIDYSIEFRNYGCTISLEKRNLSRKQLLMNPYYPIDSGKAFQGFPNEAKQHVVIFSGSSFYKVYGRDNAYFKLVKRLLKENPECVLLFAGSGDKREISKFIKENHLEKRFLLLGSRSDINEVFAHCDIYLGTYPICGGLMSQLAAVNSKPILAYTTPDIQCNYLEGIVCHKKSVPVTFTNKDAFFTEAKKMVSCEKYRIQRGESLRKAIITPSDFNRSFELLLTTKESNMSFEHEIIDYNSFSELYLEVENNYQDTFKRLLLKKFRFKTPFLFPTICLKILLSFLFNKLLSLRR